ncbi:hypothetical protein ADEAN_000848200 [Angomonas deanei]|uniref:Uncharacterized protein n=1 Tax=Angomonas deanei TaxID=59799 RepID=A0A7G2CMA1_9TRYP|nr:hypothetical protein ADEAN_000848200 [Angomonas deanei]
MSAVSSFVLSCVESGRWARGLMALSMNNPKEEPSIREASLKLVPITAPHNWISALQLLEACLPASSKNLFPLLCRSVDALARNKEIPNAVYVHSVKQLIQNTGLSSTQQTTLFLASTRWTSLKTVEEIHGQSGHTVPEMQRRREQLTAINLRTSTCGWGAVSTPAPSDRINVPRTFPTAQDEREYVAMQRILKRSEKAALYEEERVRVEAAVKPYPTVSEVASLLQLASRVGLAESDPSLSEATTAKALEVMGQHRLVDELVFLYIRFIGLRAPSLWKETLERIQHSTDSGAVGKLPPASLLVWLASRGSWSAGVELLEKTKEQFSQKEIPVVRDVVERTPVPSYVLQRLFKPAQTVRPFVRLPNQKRRDIAVALAQGYNLQEIQLDKIMHAWAKQGRWEATLALYLSIPNPGFQKYALQSLLKSRPVIQKEKPVNAEDISTLLSPPSHIKTQQSVSLTTYALYELIRHSEGASMAERISRRAIGNGAQYNPQVMSALIDRSVSFRLLQEIANAYPAAANAGIKKRAKEVYHKSL